MRLALIFRSKKLKYHSIENVFGALHSHLCSYNDVESIYVEKEGFKLSNLLHLRTKASKQPHDTVFHVTGDIHYTVFALPRKRTLLTIHDCVFINKRKGLKGWFLRKLFLDWPVRYVPMITTISEKTKAEVISLTGCNANKIRVINNPVSPLIRYTDKDFNVSNPVLLFIGSLPNKNLNRVIDALKGLPCTLHIIGYANEVQQTKMRDYGINFILERDISNNEMVLRYEQADVVLFPSLYEGFGLPIIEGFKAGRAVLTSNISPLKEISDGASWLVDPYDVNSIRGTLERIITDAESRNRKIKNGLTIVNRFSPSSVASQYNQAYSDLRLQRFAV